MHRKLMLCSILIGMWLMPCAVAADDKAPSLFGRDNDAAPKKDPYQWCTAGPSSPRAYARTSFGSRRGFAQSVFAFHRGALYPIMMFDGATGKFLKSLGEGMFMHPHGLSVTVRTTCGSRTR